MWKQPHQPSSDRQEKNYIIPQCQRGERAVWGKHDACKQTVSGEEGTECRRQQWTLGNRGKQRKINNFIRVTNGKEEKTLQMKCRVSKTNDIALRMGSTLMDPFTANLLDSTTLLLVFFLFFPFSLSLPGLWLEVTCTRFCAFLPAVPCAWKVPCSPASQQWHLCASMPWLPWSQSVFSS